MGKRHENNNIEIQHKDITAKTFFILILKNLFH